MTVKMNRLINKEFIRSIYQYSQPTYLSNISPASSTATLTKETYEIYQLEENPKVCSNLDKEEALKLYTNMQRIRRMERLLESLYYKKQIRGFCHTYVGQEACAVGLNSVMGPNDTIITSYRCHGWSLLMGETMKNVIGELLGKSVGSSRGKGGSMHIYGKNFYGGNGIVGAHIPLGTGIALAHKYRNNNAISFTVYGDGACDQGQTFESYNIAKLWNLPVIYVVENNLYSMGTSVKRHSANPNYFKRGDLIPGIRMDGMDVLAIKEAGKFAVKHVKDGKGPIILQLDTYRYSGHSMSDPGTTYRSKEEIQEVRTNKDCIKLFSDRLLSSNTIKEDELKNIENQVKKEVEDALAACQKDKEIGTNEVIYDCYKDYKFKLKLPQINNYQEHKTTGKIAVKE